LKPFFSGPRNCSAHWSEDRSPVNRVLDKISDAKRYLDQQERFTLEKKSPSWSVKKTGWITTTPISFCSGPGCSSISPLTYSLLLFTAAHIVLVFAFSGGAQ